MRWAAWLFLFPPLFFPPACAGADYEMASLTGVVGAPGGMLAAERWHLFGSAHAHVPGLQAVINATVELIEVPRGQVLAAATTDARGAYTMTVPPRFEAGPRFIVRAGGRMDAMVTGPLVNITPATDATARLFIEHADINRVRSSDVLAVLPLVEHLAWEVQPAASGIALAAALREAAANDEDLYNIVSSMGAAGEISGTVTDTAGNPLEGVTLVVRNALGGGLRAMGRSIALGLYRLRVPPGEYTVDAINETARSNAGSASATRKTVVGEMPVKRNFRLAPGGRVSGIVTGADGARLTNIRIRVRAARSGRLVAEMRTQDHGGYRINLRAGTYVLTAENPTLQPYASSLAGQRLDVKAGAEATIDLVLDNGAMASGVAAPGAMVRVDDAETKQQMAVVRANRAGEYRLWLKPGRYTTSAMQ